MGVVSVFFVYAGILYYRVCRFIFCERDTGGIVYSVCSPKNITCMVVVLLFVYTRDVLCSGVL